MNTEQMEQRSPEWHAARLESVGGSEVASLFGVGYKTAFDVWMDKMGRSEPLEDNGDMRRGRAFEAVAVAMWRDKTLAAHPDADGWAVGLVRAVDGVRMHHSPDLMARVAGELVLVECKVPRPAKVRRMEIEGVPLDWMLQCQHGMSVTGAARAELVVLDVMSGDIAVYQIRRSEVIIAKIIAKVERFWQYVVDDVPPYDMIDADVDALDALRDAAGLAGGELPNATEQVIDGPVLIQDYQDACDRFKMAEEAKETAKEALEGWFSANVSGGTGKAAFGAVVANRYAIAGRKSINMDLLRAEHGEIDWARYEMTGRGSAALRLSKNKETK